VRERADAYLSEVVLEEAQLMLVPSHSFRRLDHSAIRYFG
jgi:hypothetical protein